jgi:glycosyltransferase involved in cell wall biosynthesis
MNHAAIAARRCRVLILTVGGPATASTRYRVLALVPALEHAGFAVRVRYPLRGRAAPRALWRAADLLRDAVGRRAADLVLIHRKTFPPALAARLRRARQPLLFDFDDALDLPPPGRPDHPRYARNFRATVGAADTILCGNAELARRAAHPRAEILPTSVDTDRFAPGAVRAAAGPVLGWVGHADNLRYLEALAGVLHEILRRHPALRIVVGADRPPALPGLPVEYRPWSLERELAIFDGIGVGLMPLADDPWTRGKCAFKALQYMALGIPAVASPVGANREVIENGRSGLLPATDAEWLEALDGLLANPDRARALGAAGRAVVEARYSLDRAARRLIALLTAAGSART